MRKAALMGFLFLMIYVAPALGQSRKVLFPRFYTGTGWTSEFFFTNQGLTDLSINVDFFEKEGTALSVDSNLGAGSSFTFSLNGGATQAIHLNPSSSVMEGYVIATYPSSTSAARGSMVYRFEQNGTVLVEAGVPQQEFGQHYSFPVAINSANGINTAVGFTKPAYMSSYDESLVVSLFNPDGTLRKTKLVPMKAGQHLAHYVNDGWLFPGEDNFTGSISVSSPFGIGVLVLRQDKEAFGAVPSDGGPIQSWFAFSGAAVQEAEPNDSTTAAQSLSGSAVVDGSISQSGDLDTYKFSGKAGDVVTIIGDTTQKNSSLDPMLFLFNVNLTAISANDQNGLSPRQKNSSDSFIQCVLPQDGTYYIMVVDYHGGTGGYNLHVNLRHPEL
jgi:hypothetical protein